MASADEVRFMVVQEVKAGPRVLRTASTTVLDSWEEAAKQLDISRSCGENYAPGRSIRFYVAEVKEVADECPEV